VNLTRFVQAPFREEARFDWATFREVVAVFTRMLDNVVEMSGLPLEQQRHEIEHKRRHGMGFLGLGSTLTMLRMKYGSTEAVEFTERVSRELALTGWRTGLELAREKGPAPIMNEAFTVTRKCWPAARKWCVTASRSAISCPVASCTRATAATCSASPRWSRNWWKHSPRRVAASRTTPRSRRPATISLSLANNASNGIEPSFAHQYSRNVIREGKKSKEKIDVFSYELLAYRELVNTRATPYSTDPDEQLPEYFLTSEDIAPKQHVDIQAASQKWIDSSISKTINVRRTSRSRTSRHLFLRLPERPEGLHTFRFNPERSRACWSRKRISRRRPTSSSSRTGPPWS